MGRPQIALESPGKAQASTGHVARWYAPRLDIIRFVAFALVFAEHNLARSSFMPASARPKTVPIGQFGVIVFFVLSAYLIGRLLLIERQKTHTISLRKYWPRRILRIWPLYFFIVLGTYLVAPVLRAGDHSLYLPSASSFAGWITFLENWAAPATVSYLGMFWTVCVEEQIYFLFPLVLLLAIGRMRLVLAAMIVAGPVACYLTVRSGAHYPSVWNFTTSHLDAFGIGLGMALLDSQIEASTWWARVKAAVVSRAGIVALVVGTAGYIVVGAAVGPEFWSGYATAVTYITASVLAAGWVLVASGSRPLGWQSSSSTAWLGRRGYGLYAWHWPVLLVVVQIPLLTTAGGLLTGPGFAASLAITIALAILSYQYLEVRFLRRRLRFQVVGNRL